MKHSALFALFLTLLAPAAFAQETDPATVDQIPCYDGDRSPIIDVSGTIRIVRFTHPNGSPLSAHMLQLDTPICYTIEGMESRQIEAYQTPQVQVIGNLSSLRDGQRVSLRGELSTENLTAYYLSPVAIRIQ